MAYTHKKSIRKLTDKQFSQGTAIDASEIDEALEDSVERFNKMSTGDLSTRMTPTQFVFGYTPTPIASQPTYDQDAGIDYIVPTAAAGLADNTYAPWMPIINSKYTSVTVDTTADPTAVLGYGQRYSNEFTPTEGFQNKWRIKGTHIESSRARISNDYIEWPGALQSAYWGNKASGPPSGNEQVPRQGYQHAWTNSWQFSKPCIIDDISIMLRTDDTTNGLFNIDWSYDDGAPPNTFGAADFFVVLHVDSPTAPEDRSANDVEAHFGNTDIYLSRVSMGQKPGAIFSYSEMEPLVQGRTGGSGFGLSGRTVRWRDMNIPIHQGARVRLSLVVPVHSTASIDAGGWSKQRLPDQIYVQKTTWNEIAHGTGGTWTLPVRYLCVHNFSMNGVMTVLEEVQG